MTDTGGAACGVNEIGALAEALALAVATDRVAGAGLAGGGAPTGVADASGWSPLTARVLILRGSLLGNVPFPALAGGRVFAATLEAGGGLVFGFSCGNTTRGPDLALTSTGASSRGTILSAPSPVTMRSGNLGVASAGDGTILVGPASALMIGGSPLRGDPT